MLQPGVRVFTNPFFLYALFTPLLVFSSTNNTNNSEVEIIKKICGVNSSTFCVRYNYCDKSNQSQSK